MPDEPSVPIPADEPAKEAESTNAAEPMEVEEASKEESGDSGNRRSTRERKVMEKFRPGPAVVEKAEFEIKEGKGKKLADIENVSTIMNRFKSDDAAMKMCHKLCYKRDGKSTTRKRNLRQFSGVWDIDEKEVRDRVLKVKPVSLLKEVATVFDCKPQGNITADYQDSVVKFLLKPTASGNEVPLTDAAKRREKSAKKSVVLQKKRDRSRCLCVWYYH